MLGVVYGSAAVEGWSGGFRGQCQGMLARTADGHHVNHTFPISVAAGALWESWCLEVKKVAGSCREVTKVKSIVNKHILTFQNCV